VTYAVSATDDVDPAPVVNCTPESRSDFPIGDTTVVCTATDASGNAATASFTVHVRDAGEQTANLIALVLAMNAKQGILNGLDAKLETVKQAVAAANAGNRLDACNKLDAFIKEVESQAGKALTAHQATELKTAAARIRGVLGCSP
jgi:HYR domain